MDSTAHIRNKLKASVLIESLVATAIVAIVLSIGLNVLFGSVWSSQSFLEESALREFSNIETAYRRGLIDTGQWEFDAFRIEANVYNRYIQITEIELIATDASNRTLATHKFIIDLK